LCEIDDTQTEKKYFCQRCLNHDLQFPRKGHKPMCKYASCTCSDCIMVEQRRQLNNMLSKSKLAESPRETVNGRRIRDPQCARCRQHGIRVPLRGHKRVLCQFANCKCEMVSLLSSIHIPIPIPSTNIIKNTQPCRFLYFNIGNAFLNVFYSIYK
uniref:DM domain-containing protein n=1 Tax=Angiostrongylus cantonensis TaxID=6313 RepID=A0A0K0CXA7_ANGCA